MFRQILNSLATAMLGLGMIAAIQAAEFRLDALPMAAFDPVSFAPLPLSFDASGNLVGNRPMVVEVDIDLFSTGYNPAADQRGFGAMTFDLDLSGSFHNTSRPGWRAENPLVGTWDSSVHDSPRWFVNTDAGKPGDLQSILISNALLASPNAVDPRPALTTGTAIKIGSVFIDWDGVGLGGLRIVPGDAAFAKNSDGKLQMFSSDELVTTGGMFHTPGWTPPPPPPPVIPPAPPAAPTKPVTSPPVASPPASAPPATAPPSPVAPVAAPPTGRAPVDPAQSIIGPVAAPPTDAPAIDPQRPIDVTPPPQTPHVDPVIDPISIAPFIFQPWFGDARSTIDMTGNLTIAFGAIDAAFFTVASAASLVHPAEGLPEPPGLWLAAIAMVFFGVASVAKWRSSIARGVNPS